MWNPEQYLQFSNERFRPALDLMARIPEETFGSIIDLGCGSGELTQLLREKYHPKKIVGLDNDPNMLAKAAAQDSIVDWQQVSIDQFTGQYDLVFSNAALQWLDHHEQLFHKIIEQAKKVIAIQVPNNFSYPSHVLLRETIHEHAHFYQKLAPTLREAPVLSATMYFNFLHPHTTSLDIWETSYLQPLSGENAVLEWVKGTALVPVRAGLTAEEYQEFLSLYNEKLLKAYPPQADGITLFPFSRLFIVAKK